MRGLCGLKALAGKGLAGDYVWSWLRMPGRATQLLNAHVHHPTQWTGFVVVCALQAIDAHMRVR